MIDPDDPLDVQVSKQARIIDALVRRAGRHHDVGNSAYAAFQSAIALQGQVWAKTRDLERASNELEILRFDRERTQKNLSDALSVMDGGFALFDNGKLHVWNELFGSLLPDISDRIRSGLSVNDYFAAVASSSHLVGDEGRELFDPMHSWGHRLEGEMVTYVIELQDDRWFQWSQQRTGSDALVILQTEITGVVRKNRLEKDKLIDTQVHYLQAAFENMSLGIATFSRTGTLMLHNDRFRDLLGLPVRMVQTGTHFAAILDYIRKNALFPETDFSAIEDWRLQLRREGDLRERLDHTNGRVIDLHAHQLPDRGFLLDVKDTTLESRTTQLLEKRVEERTRELTEANRQLTQQSHVQERVEEELRLAKERAEAAVSSKTRFLAAASHDLLQPINAAKLLISTLSDMTRESIFAEMVDRLEGSFASVEALLHALLDISRLESTESSLSTSDFCLGPLMEAVTEDQAPLAAKKGVRLDVVPSSVWVKSDQRYLLRSIQNLVVNAIQYTQSGRVLVGCRRRNGHVVLEVWDTGIGISQKDQARIFDEFTRVESMQPAAGMGLGLSIVERACRHLGHRIAVRSKPGVGSVFSIEIEEVCARPLIEHDSDLLDSGHQADMNLLVLVIENDTNVLFATVKKLENWGASAFATRSTAEALEVIRDAGIAPDIILADYQLDGEDTGIAAINAVRVETGVEIPALMLTADRSTKLVREGTKLNFTVLPKPVDLARLRRSIALKTRRAVLPELD